MTRWSKRPRLLPTICLLVGLFLFVPTVVVIPLSFTGIKSFKFPPPNWSLQWYETLVSSSDWRQSFSTSIQLAVCASLLAVLLGTAAAFGLSRGRLPGKPLASGLLLSPTIVPVVIAATAIYVVSLNTGLTGTFQGLLLAHTAMSLPLVIVSVSASLQSHDNRLENAAASLGARPVVAFIKVVMPLIAPGILSGAVFAFATSLDEVVLSLFLVDPTIQTLPTQMFRSVTEEVDPTVAAASSVLFLATVLVFFAVIVSGNKRRSRVA